MNEFIIGIKVQNLFDDTIKRLDLDPETGYDRDFWSVFEEHINAVGLHDDIHDERGAQLIATRKWLPTLAKEWMERVDETNDTIAHGIRCQRLSIPE